MNNGIFVRANNAYSEWNKVSFRMIFTFVNYKKRGILCIINQMLKYIKQEVICPSRSSNLSPTKVDDSTMKKYRFTYK